VEESWNAKCVQVKDEKLEEEAILGIHCEGTQRQMPDKHYDNIRKTGKRIS